MNKSTKIVLGLGAIAIVIGGIQDVMNRETSGLRQAHQAVAWEKNYSSSVECEYMKDEGETWALCRFWRSAPSAWVKRGEGWAAANGPALMVIDWVAQIDTSNDARPYQNLPHLERKQQPAIYMTKAVSARLNVVSAEIASARR
jgi:hypothetical protein